MQRKHHRWNIQEENTIYNNKHMSPKDIKENFFAKDDTITVQAIADKLSRIVDEREQPNYGKPWLAPDEEYLSNNLDKSNVELKTILGRGSKELDQAKWDIRHFGKINPKRKNKPRNINFTNPPKQVPVQIIQDTPINPALQAEVNRAYDLIKLFKEISPSAIKHIRDKRKKNENNPEPVQVYDYLKVPTTKDLDLDSDLFKHFTWIRKRVEYYNKLSLGKADKASTISTHQFNLLRLIMCLRVTSHQNLNIQNNVVEIRNVLNALQDYYTGVSHGMKVIPSKFPIPRIKPKGL